MRTVNRLQMPTEREKTWNIFFSLYVKCSSVRVLRPQVCGVLKAFDEEQWRIICYVHEMKGATKIVQKIRHKNCMSRCNLIAHDEILDFVQMPVMIHRK